MKNLLIVLLLASLGSFCKGEVLSADAENSESVVENINGWVKNAEYVKGYLFDYRKDEFRPLLKDGKLHPGLVESYTRRLNVEQYTKLLSAITGKHESHGGILCHYPHHGFVFYDKNHRALGFIDVCFLCTTTSQRPMEGLSTYWDLEALKLLVEELKLPNFANLEQWSNFFRDAQQEKVPKIKKSKQAHGERR